MNYEEVIVELRKIVDKCEYNEVKGILLTVMAAIVSGEMAIDLLVAMMREYSTLLLEATIKADLIAKEIEKNNVYKWN